MFAETYREMDDDKFYKVEFSSMRERSTMMSDTTATRSGQIGEDITFSRAQEHANHANEGFATVKLHQFLDWVSTHILTDIILDQRSTTASPRSPA